MNPALAGLGFCLLGYLSGSLPFAIWITRQVKGVDVRNAGSGHATATNTLRQAGLGPGALVLMLDLTKGFLPTWLAVHFAPGAWIIPLTAAAAVVGHCWPLFAQLRGGMGLATAGGCLLTVNLPAFLLGLAILIAATLIIHHAARASVFTGIVLTPLLWLTGRRGLELWISLAVGAVIAYRFLIDWNRKYRELWLDREKTH